MTPEQLLKPRYKVIADYPLSNYSIGDVLEHGGFTAPYNGNHKTEIFDNYPNLFKKLQWWEERDPDEMPAYIKWSPTPDEVSFFKVEATWTNPNTGEIFGVYVDLSHRLFIRDCQPATLKEYNNYINSKK